MTKAVWLSIEDMKAIYEPEPMEEPKELQQLRKRAAEGCLISKLRLSRIEKAVERVIITRWP